MTPRRPLPLGAWPPPRTRLSPLDAVLSAAAWVVERWLWWRGGRPEPPKTLAEYQERRRTEDVNVNDEEIL